MKEKIEKKFTLKQHLGEAILMALIIVFGYIAIRNAIIKPIEDEREESESYSQNH